MNIQLLTNYRTGSNRLIKLIEQNYKNMLCLYEPFAQREFYHPSPITPTWIIENNKVIIKEFPEIYFKQYKPNNYLQHKIQIIKETLSNNSYVFKSQPNEWINEEIKNSIINLLPKENTKVISRRNVLEQIASYQLARNQGNWLKPINYSEKFRIEHYVVLDIIKSKLKLENLTDFEIYYYEDMPNNPNDCIEWLGLKRNFEIKEYQEKINYNILDLVINIKEVEVWVEQMYNQ